MLPRPEGFTPMNKKRLAIAALLLLVVAVTAYLYIGSRAQEADGIIRVSGNIEVTEAEVSFKIPGRVVERLVSEGETVKAGQMVARPGGGGLGRGGGLGASRGPGGPGRAGGTRSRVAAGRNRAGRSSNPTSPSAIR